MRKSELRIAVIGAGLGGLVAGAMLQKRGCSVRIFEQAPEFARLGAGINLGPNVMKVLRHIGIEQRLLDFGLRPVAWVSRDWSSGETLFALPLRGNAEAQYGAPYMVIHRGDFHAVLMEAVAPGTIEFGMKLTGLDPRGSVVDLRFENGDRVEVDLVIGADGINSRVREVLLGPELPAYTGYVAHRSIFPTALLGGLKIHDLTKWWSDDAHKDTHLVVYHLDKNREETYFVSGVPEPQWDYGLSFVQADLDEMRASFEGFHPEVQKVLEVCPAATKWPLFDRLPLPLWSSGQIVMLGDACHPMKPHMGQGAAMAIEDAAILVRCLERCGDDFKTAFSVYEMSRKDRTSLVQKHSRDNKWLRHEMDPGWVFHYDALEAPLPDPAPAGTS